MAANTSDRDLAERVRLLEAQLDNLQRRRSGDLPNLRDLRDANLTKAQNGQVPTYNQSTGQWDPVVPAFAHHAATHYGGGTDDVGGTPPNSIPNATNTNNSNSGPGLAYGNHEHQVVFGVSDSTVAAGSHQHAEPPQPSGYVSKSIGQTFTHGDVIVVAYGNITQTGMVWDPTLNALVALVEGNYRVRGRSKWNPINLDNGTTTVHLVKGFAGQSAASDVEIDDDHAVGGGNTAANHEITNVISKEVNMNVGDRLYCTALTYITGGTPGVTTRTMVADSLRASWLSVVRAGPKLGAGTLAAPVIGTPAAGAGQATANWSAVATASGYVVTTFKASDNSIIAVNSLGNVLTYVKTGLTAGVGVYFKVAALYPAGNGASNLSAASSTVTPT